MTEKYENAYGILKHDLAHLEARIGQLNKRADKLQVPGITIREVGRKNVKRNGYVDTIIYVELDGGIIKLDGGYYFVGTIEHTSAGNILRNAPFLEPPFTLEGIPAKYRHTDPICEHCNLKRNRIDTYVVANPDGQTLQVGRSCLKDFTGHRDPHALAALAEALAEIRELAERLEDPEFLGGGGGGHSGQINMVEFLTYVGACIRLWGWTPRSTKDPYATPTANEALNWLTSPLNKNGSMKYKDGKHARTRDGQDITITDEDEALAKATRLWVLEIPEADYIKNDYLFNLTIAFLDAGENDGITLVRRLGIVASSVFVYKRKLAEIEEAKALAKTNGREPGHVGTIKKRQQFDGLQLVRVNESEGHYGTNWYHTFITPDGDTLVWKKTTYPPLTEGETYSGKATVKEHSEYNGVPQTYVTRAAFTFQCCDEPDPGENTNPEWVPGLNPIVCQNCGAAH